MIFLRTKRKTRYSTQAIYACALEQKTHHQKKSGDVWKPCIRNPAAYLLCSSKSPFSL